MRSVRSRSRLVAALWVVVGSATGCDEPGAPSSASAGASAAQAPGAAPAAKAPSTRPAPPPAVPSPRPGAPSPGGSEDEVDEPPGAGSAVASGASEEGDEEGGEGACAAKNAALKPLQLLAFTFTSKVDKRMPTDTLHVAYPGKRVWVHMRLRNRSGEGRCVHVEFRVNGKKRTEVELDIGESWNWRTYAFFTLRDSDTSGIVEARVTDDQGALVVEKRLGILPPKRK
ncbi:MAG: hypothetical protein HY908_11360 [Myxococcales bacterium]|nr:hypothetical protein [Myxococcales bacterium]